MTPTKETKENAVFREVIDGLQKRLNLSTQQLSLQTNYSTAAISLVKTGGRNLTSDFAAALSRVLGGTEDLWLKVYASANSESPRAAADYIAELLAQGQAVGVKLASGVRRLVNHEIYNLFDRNGDRGSFRDYFEADARNSHGICHIDDFDASRIQPTSYDTRIGWTVPFDPVKDRVAFEKIREIDSGITLPGCTEADGSNSILLLSAEHFELPYFIEGEVHPAHTLSLKVEVGNGPVIDPGFNGRLCVRVTNPRPEPVRLTVGEAFLTVRFNLLSTLPLDDEAMERAFGVIRYNAARQTA